MDVLIAESGGTKTDWCLIRNKIVTDQFLTVGLNPNAASESDWQQVKSELIRRIDPASCQIVFYGAGCLRDSGRIKVEDKLHRIGFRNITIYSDLHAAGRALFGSGSGWGAILGTGSVLFRYDHGAIREVIGGKGHLEGDEGSGFYFGKLLVERIVSGNLSEEQRSVLDRKNLDLGKLVRLIGTTESKIAFSDLSRFLNDESAIFKEIHEKNLQLFIDTHIRGRESELTGGIGISGGYASHVDDILQDVFRRNNLIIKKVIVQPMAVLIEQMVSATD